MSTLTVTNTYIAGTLAKASEVNQNFTDILTWASAGGGGVNYAGIQNDNFGIFTGPLKWTVVTNVLALDISSSGNDSVIDITKSAALNASKAGIRLYHSAAETSGDAAMYILMDSAGTTIPGLKVAYSGTGNVIQLTDGSDDLLTVDNAGAAFLKSDLEIDGNLDVDGAGPHTIANNLDVDSVDVAGLLTCDTINATSATGTSTFTNDLDVQGTLTVATFNPNALTVTTDATIGDDLFVRDQLGIGPAAGEVYLSRPAAGRLRIGGLIQFGGVGTNYPILSAVPARSTVQIASSDGTEAHSLVSCARMPTLGEEQHIRIIRGQIQMQNGTPQGGEDFNITVVGGVPNQYISVSFDHPFIDPPMVVATPRANEDVWISGVNNTGFTVNTPTDNTLVVDFIAAGNSY